MLAAATAKDALGVYACSSGNSECAPGEASTEPQLRAGARLPRTLVDVSPK